MNSINHFYKTIQKKIFGEPYSNRKDIAQYWYFRVLFVRVWLIDMPLAIAISLWIIPWEELYGNPVIQKLVYLMENVSPNIEKNKRYSEFPEFAVTFLSVIHLIGALSLVLPFIYSVSSEGFKKGIKKKGYRFGMKMTIYAMICTFVFLYGHLTLGAISYFGCHRCSYSSKLSLVTGAFLVWLFIHHSIAGGLLILKATNDLRQKGEI